MEEAPKNIEIIEKFDDFVFDLVDKCKQFNEIDSDLNLEPVVKNTLKNRLLVDFGKEKELFSLKNSKYRHQKEIFVYKEDNEICINSKGTCLGDGQHSTATFIILNEVFNNTDKCHISLLQKFGWSYHEFNSEFGKSVDEIKQNILLQLDKSGLSLSDTPNAEEIKKSLVIQAANPVLWEDCVAEMVNFGVEAFVEVGPGKVLTGFTKKIKWCIHRFIY